MKISKLELQSLVHSLGVLVYVSGVAWIMQNGERIFGHNFWGPVVLLLLFVFSALITGLLVLGRPIYLFLNGEKTDAVKMLFYTVGWMFVIITIVLVVNVFS
jgi:hypothetical protein